MSKKETLRKVFKWVIYALLLLTAYMLQTTRGLTVPIFGARPLLILGVSLSVSFLEPLVPAGIFAFFSGLLMDYASDTLFGYYGFFFVALALGLALLTQFATLPTAWTFILSGGGAVLIQGHIDFLFRDALLEMSGTGAFYVTRLLPMLVYTVAMTYAVFFLVRWIHRRLTPGHEQEMLTE